MKTLITLVATAFFILGCTPQPQPQPVPVVKPKPKPKPKLRKHPAISPAPKKDIELKEVEDENFSSAYMYPETDKKTAKKSETLDVSAAQTTVSAMTKEECVSMIGQKKFDQYTQMYGGESASLKKCKMLKSL